MSVTAPLSADAPFSPIYDEQLQQGSLYIIKVKQVSLALFEGSEVEPMRWSETRQLPGDFDIYNAFDEYGNPPVHLWSRYLKTSLPTNWFYMFEEARRKQRMWFKQRDDYIQHNPIPEISQGGANPSFSNTDVSSMLLSPQDSNASLAIASTNIIDPNISNGNTSSMSAHTSIDDVTETTNEGKYAISPKSTSLVIDREQIRRHLAPGQATALNRQSMSTYTKSSSPLSNTFHNATEENRFTVQQYSSQLDFPHDSDQFSIRSDLPSNPSLLVPTKTHSRSSMKNTV